MWHRCYGQTAVLQWQCSLALTWSVILQQRILIQWHMVLIQGSRHLLIYDYHHVIFFAAFVASVAAVVMYSNVCDVALAFSVQLVNTVATRRDLIAVCPISS